MSVSLLSGIIASGLSAMTKAGAKRLSFKSAPAESTPLARSPSKSRLHSSGPVSLLMVWPSQPSAISLTPQLTKYMNRLKIYCLNNTGEVFTTYADIPSLINFLSRSVKINRLHTFGVHAVKGNRVLVMESIVDINDLTKKLNAFNLLP